MTDTLKDPVRAAWGSVSGVDVAVLVHRKTFFSGPALENRTLCGLRVRQMVDAVKLQWPT